VQRLVKHGDKLALPLAQPALDAAVVARHAPAGSRTLTLAPTCGIALSISSLASWGRGIAATHVSIAMTARSAAARRNGDIVATCSRQ
jgi:hypothetical protein